MDLILTIIGGAIIISGAMLGTMVAYDAIAARFKQRSRPLHNHDCLVEQCDFHSDREVDTMMREWLKHNKRRGVELRKHALKEFALNLFIAEVAARRPLTGDITWNDDI